MQNLDTLNLNIWKSEFTEEECNFEKVQEYLDFIKEAIDRYDPERYSEKHHIIPKCIDKQHKYNKQVCRINGADHLKAHMMLVECFNGYKKYLLGSALAIIRRKRNLEYLSPEDFEEARRLYSLSQTGELNHSYGKPSSCQNRVWITNGILCKRVFKDEPLPEGWRYGNPKFSNNGLIGITDGVHNKYILPTDEIPEGWRKGNVGKAQPRYKEQNGVYGKIWVTDGKSNRLIAKDEVIPDGWHQGATQNNPDQHGTNSAIYGKISITNGKESRLIYPDEPLPDGWRYGQKQNHSKYGNNRNQGKIYITNGIKNKMITKEESIPEGWRRGMTRMRGAI